MTQIYIEHFDTDTGSDLTLSTHAAATGQTPSFSQRISGASGAVVFSASGTARSTLAAANEYAANVTPPTAYQVHLDVVVQSLVSGVGFSACARLPNSGTNQDCYRAQIQQLDNAGSGQFRLQRVSTIGGGTTLATGPGLTLTASDIYTMVLDISTTNQQILFANGTARCVSFDTVITRSGRAGLASAVLVETNTSGIHADNLIVEDMTGLPVATVIPAITGTVQTGNQLTCSNGTWSGSPTAFAYQWCRDGTAIVGSTASTYTLVTADEGHAITCVVKATNANGFAGAAATPVNATGPVVPANTNLPQIQTDGTPSTGEVISCTTGTWTASPTSFAYQWNRDGTPLTGATSANYTLVIGDEGHAITCTVTASNANGSGSATSASITPTPPGSPTITTSPSISGIPFTGQTLTRTAGVWSGNTSPITWTWQRNGVDIPSTAGQPTYVLVQADEGAAITVHEVATNSGGSSGASSNAITPQAVPPLTLDLFVTGGATNSSGAASLGGAIGASSSTLHVFDDVLGSEAASGTVEYRAVAVHNPHPLFAATSVRIWITQVPSAANNALSIAAATEAVNSPVQQVPNERTAPTDITTFSTPTDVNSGVSLGNIPPGQYAVIWLRRTITAGAQPAAVTAQLGWSAVPQ